jgi:cellulose 1,4-beta-cellobiosidase
MAFDYLRWLVSGLTTSAYTNTGLTNGTTYYYVVTAFDTADNESDDSSEVSAKPQANGTGQFNPTDDSFVNQSNPTGNFGSNTTLKVRGDSAGYGRWPFLKFTVSGVSGSVTSAKLKLYSTDVTQSVTAKAVSNTSWTEGNITWNNMPTIGSTLDTKSPGASSWVEFDVTSHVTGNGTYSFCLQGSVDSAQVFESKEGGSNDPVLELTYGDDTTAPAAPTGLTATAGDTEILLDWNDNSESDIASYSVWRDTSTGGPYTEIASGLTTSAYTDTGRTNGTTYYYVVTAFDNANNESSDSSEASATPHGILSFNPTDDALVNHKMPDNNYGSENYMAVRSDSASKGRNSFLKFTVSGVSGTVTSAKLKLYSQTVEMSVEAKAVSNTSWTEGAITWNNQPSAGSTLDTKSPGTATWVEFNVTSHVTGNGTYSFRLSGNVDTGQVFDTKEATNKPVLVVDCQ